MNFDLDADRWANAITLDALKQSSGGIPIEQSGLHYLTSTKVSHRRAARLARELPYWRWMASVGIIVDRRSPFTYGGYEFLKPIYQTLPADTDAWPDFSLTIMKAAQCGASIFALGVPIYCSLRVPGFSTTYFLPDQTTAIKMSGERFMELIRPNAELYQILRDSNIGTQKNEGSKHLRRFGSGFIFFGYLGGGMQTESMPLDLLEFDEVQGMTSVQMEKARERVAASRWKMTLRLSTALMPDSDIHSYFKMSDQRYWHTRCNCGDDPARWVILSEIWPNCIGESRGKSSNISLGNPSGVHYRCPRCDTVIEHPRRGRYVPHAPENAPHYGFHFAQTLLPTLTPAQLFQKYRESRDLQNFHNRCLGRPYEAEDKIPVSMQVLREKVFRDDLSWVVAPRRGAVTGGLMGIDHMGGFSCVTIMARLGDTGHRYRIVWQELIESEDPWRRCDQLMEEYGVVACCVENTPNYNEARRFARRHFGRVWIVNYQQLAGEMCLWKDKARPNASQARTDPEQELPFLVGVDQYRMMSYALGMVQAGMIFAPNPEKQPLMQYASVQPFVSNRMKATSVNIALDSLVHLTRIALMTQEALDPLNPQRKAPFVVKIGYDPHFAFSYMLAALASVRAYGAASILDMGAVMPAPMDARPTVAKDTATSAQFQRVIEIFKPTEVLDRCGSCSFRGRDRGNGWMACTLRNVQVRPTDQSCSEYLAGSPESPKPLGVFDPQDLV